MNHSHGRGTCPQCDKALPLKDNGTVAEHAGPRDEYFRAFYCKGSAQPPKSDTAAPKSRG